MLSAIDRNPVRNQSEHLSAIAGIRTVADRMLNISVAQIVLQRPGIDAVVGELVASGMSEHVRVRLEREPRLLAGPLHQAGQPGPPEGRLAFRHEDHIAARHPLSLYPPHPPHPI